MSLMRDTAAKSSASISLEALLPVPRPRHRPPAVRAATRRRRARSAHDARKQPPESNTGCRSRLLGQLGQARGVEATFSAACSRGTAGDHQGLGQAPGGLPARARRAPAAEDRRGWRWRGPATLACTEVSRPTLTGASGSISRATTSRAPSTGTSSPRSVPSSRHQSAITARSTLRCSICALLGRAQSHRSGFQPDSCAAIHPGNDSPRGRVARLRDGNDRPIVKLRRSERQPPPRLVPRLEKSCPCVVVVASSGTEGAADRAAVRAGRPHADDLPSLDGRVGLEARPTREHASPEPPRRPSHGPRRAPPASPPLLPSARR